MRANNVILAILLALIWIFYRNILVVALFWMFYKIINVIIRKRRRAKEKQKYLEKEENRYALSTEAWADRVE